MEIVMPKMGESINEGTILKWHKKKGDYVKRDEIIYEISTDKVDTEIPSPSEGILSDIRYNEGDVVEVGAVVAVINENQSESSSIQKFDEARQEKPESLSAEEIKPVQKAPDNENKKLYQHGNIIEIQMPKMGESIMEGTVLKWHKKPGDSVKKDEILFEISTDKVDTEVPSPSDGVLMDILVKENETVEVGVIVAKLNSGNNMKPASSEVVKEESAAETTEAAPEPEKMHDNFASYSVPEEKYDRDKRFLSPLVLNIARKENISFDELDTIRGTGVGERITKKDIMGYIEQKKNKQGIKRQTPETQVSEKQPVILKSEEQVSYSVSKSESTGGIERIPMDNIRQKIMQHMVNSRDTSVHVSAMLEVDMQKISNFIENKRESYSRDGIKLTYMPFIAQACIKALKQYPLINSSIDGNTIIRKKYINLGIAVAVEPNGLIVPNIKNADEKSLTGLAKAISEVAVKARTKKLTPDDITNGTFTITNYGVFGLNFGTPIINQPEVAILGVGTVIKKPVVVEHDGIDTIAVKPVMALTISHDHRLIDGMMAGYFIKYIKDTLENFDPENI